MWREKGFVLWLTGLPCSGKTTLSNAIKQKLSARGVNVEQLDGDCIRQKYSKCLGYTKKDRMKNVRCIVSEALLQQRRGLVTLVSVISPYRCMREYAREKIEDFVEIFVRCPLSVCESRDDKGMYRLARQGKIRHFTGLSDPYEEPTSPELIVDTDLLTVEESARKIIQCLEQKEFIQQGGVVALRATLSGVEHVSMSGNR